MVFVMVFICTAQGVALFGDVALFKQVWPWWRKCVTLGVGCLKTLFVASWEASLLLAALGTRGGALSSSSPMSA